MQETWVWSLGREVGRSGKDSACQCRRLKRYRFNPWVGKIPCSRKWQPTAIFLPGKFHGQRSLAGYSPWCCEVRQIDWAHPKIPAYWMYKNPCSNLTKCSWRTYLVFYWLSGVVCFFVFVFGAQGGLKVKVKSCPTLSNPMDCSPPGSSIHGILQEEHWSRLPSPSPGDLSNPVIEPRSPALQADALPSEPPGFSGLQKHQFIILQFL